MTKDEIKKALGQCSNNCIGCPYRSDDKPCMYLMKKDALALITEQEEEIEQLKAENTVWSTQINQAYDNGYKDGYDSIEEDIIQAKIDVLTELKEKFGMYYPHAIDEMIEELKK